MKQLLLSLLWIPLIQYAALAQDYQKYLSYSTSYLDSLREAFYLEGAYQEQLLATQALQQQLYVQTGEKDSTFAGLSLELGVIYSQLGAYEEALANIEQATTLLQDLLGKKHPQYADALTYWSLVQVEMGNYKEALTLLQQALTISQQASPPNLKIYSHTLIQLAEYYDKVGNYEQALEESYKALDITEQAYGRTSKEFASALNCAGRINHQLGNHEEARDYYVEAKNIREKELGVFHPEFTMTLNDLAVLHYEKGNLQTALDIYSEIKLIDEQRGADNTLEFSALLNNMSAVFSDMGNHEKALNYLKKSIAIDESILGESHPEVSASYHNLAFLYHDLMELDKALYYYLKTKKVYQEIFGKTHPNYIIVAANLASLYLHRKQYDKVRATLQEGITLISAVDQPLLINSTWRDNMLQASYPSTEHLQLCIELLNATYQLLALIPEEPFDKKQQLLLTEVMVDLHTRLQNELHNEKDKLRVLQSSHTWLQNQLHLLDAPEDAYQAFEVSDWGKSVLLLQALQSEEDYQLGDLPDSLAQKDQLLHQNRAELQALLLEKRPEEEKKQLQAELIEANRALAQFEQNLEKNYPKYYQLQHQNHRITLEEIQAELAPHTALLEYAIGDSVIHIFYVDQQQVQWLQSYVDNKLLEKRIKSLRKALTNYALLVDNEKKAYRAYTQYAHWFYQQLLAPVLTHKKDLQNLVIVTDGKLGHLPFETFLLEEAPQELTSYEQLPYVLKDYNISYSYSAALWKENNHTLAAANNGQMMGVAANYSLLDSSILDNRIPTLRNYRKALTPLPNARAEVEALATNFEGFFAFDEQASEKLVKEKAPDYAILHFATHGILHPESPVLSSLALTETGDSTENNFWQAYEISKMKLKADLVVLSACETGYGKFEQGNGMASLARSFMYAGAPSLVVSLWQVNDYATSTIMQNFYQHLTAGMAKDAALRQAKLDYIAAATGNAAHPALWSPFIQMGSTSPVKLAQKRAFWPWFGGLLAGSMVIALGLFWRKNKRKK